MGRQRAPPGRQARYPIPPHSQGSSGAPGGTDAQTASGTGLLGANPVDGVAPPKLYRRERRIWTKAESCDVWRVASWLFGSVSVATLQPQGRGAAHRTGRRPLEGLQRLSLKNTGFWCGTPDRTRTCAPGSGGRRSIRLSYGGANQIGDSVPSPDRSQTSSNSEPRKDTPMAHRGHGEESVHQRNDGPCWQAHAWQAGSASSGTLAHSKRLRCSWPN